MTLEIRLMQCLHVDIRRKKIGPEKPPAMFSVSISVIHKQYIIHQYTSMHQADYLQLCGLHGHRINQGQ